MRRLLYVMVMGGIVGMLMSCATRTAPWPSPVPTPIPSAGTNSWPSPAHSPASSVPPPRQVEPSIGVAVPVNWSDLPGWRDAPLDPVWGMLLRNCERPTEAVAMSCADVRRLAIADDAQRRQWMEASMQPHRLQSDSGISEGLLTAYYEPVLEASRERKPGFEVPLYLPPPELASGTSRTPWFTREEIDTRADVRARLKPMAWLADPVDALVLHIQGSGRLRFKEANGSTTEVGVRFAASNNQPYRSVGRALLDARELTDASWPGIQAWFARNPGRAPSFMWTNPRYVFFKETPITEPELGPPGAQGVPLTAMRSIAVDPRAVPYGAMLWLHTRGSDLSMSQLVVAQDTGSAIVGAVRADLFAGTGTQAGALAGRIKQPLWLWVLKPR